MNLITKLCAFAALAYPALGGLVQVSTPASLNQNDSVQWFYVSGTISGTSINTASDASIGVNLTMAGGGFSKIQQAPAGSWNGDFPANAYIIDNNWGGPVTVTFATPIMGFGVSLDDAWSSLPANGTISAYHGNTLLGTFNVSGTGLFYLGFRDTTAEIDSVTFTADSQNGNGYFSFGDLQMVIPEGESSPVPEPATAGLAVVSGAAMLLARRLHRPRR